jgi:hypothetical protein
MDGIGKLVLENKQLPDHITGEEGLKDLKIMEAIYQVSQYRKKNSAGMISLQICPA